MSRFYEFMTAEGASSKRTKICLEDVSHVQIYASSAEVVMKTGQKFQLDKTTGESIMDALGDK